MASVEMALVAWSPATMLHFPSAIWHADAYRVVGEDSLHMLGGGVRSPADERPYPMLLDRSHARLGVYLVKFHLREGACCGASGAIDMSHGARTSHRCRLSTGRGR